MMVHFHDASLKLFQLLHRQPSLAPILVEPLDAAAGIIISPIERKRKHLRKQAQNTVGAIRRRLQGTVERFEATPAHGSSTAKTIAADQATPA